MSGQIWNAREANLWRIHSRHHDQDRLGGPGTSIAPFWVRRFHDLV